MRAADPHLPEATAFALDRAGKPSAALAVATVLFTAHNRKDMVLQAIARALEQTVPVHVIVADDASTDGTQAAVSIAFPGVTYLRSEASHGPCYQRNRGLEAAATDIVFPLDDDSMLVSPRSLEQALAAFREDVALVAMPFQNILQSDEVLQPPSWGGGGPFFDFVACAHGLRRKAVLEIGGFHEPYFYMGEESDLAIRLRDRGWLTLIAASDPVHHLQPPARRSYRPDFYGRRNDVLFVWLRAPGWRLLSEMPRVVARGFLFAARTGRMKATFDGYAAALRDILRGKARRAPVRPRIYAEFLRARAARKRIVDPPKGA